MRDSHIFSPVLLYFIAATAKDRPKRLHLLLIKLFSAALACLGSMYESLGRLVGRSYEETFHHLAKWIRNAEVIFFFRLSCNIVFCISLRLAHEIYFILGAAEEGELVRMF